MPPVGPPHFDPGDLRHGPLLDVEQVRPANTVGRAEAPNRSSRSRHHGQPLRPRAFLPPPSRAEPRLDQVRDRTQVVHVSAQRRFLSGVPSDPRRQPARAEGAADVHVEARPDVEDPEPAHGDRLPASAGHALLSDAECFARTSGWDTSPKVNVPKTAEKVSEKVSGGQGIRGEMSKNAEEKRDFHAQEMEEARTLEAGF